MVGRAIRDGIPVVLNLTGVAEAVAYRIVDFSAGVVFGVRGSIERVTPRVFLLSPAASFVSGTTLRIDGARPQARMGYPMRVPDAATQERAAVKPFNGFHRAHLPKVFQL